MLVSELLGHLVCHPFPLLSPMLHGLPSLMDLFLSGTINFIPMRVFLNCSLLLNQLSALVSYLSWSPMLLVVSSISYFFILYALVALVYVNPMSAFNEQYEFYRTLLRGFVDLVVAQNSVLCPAVVHHQNDLFHHLSTLKEQSLSSQLQSTISNCSPPLRWIVKCCMGTLRKSGSSETVYN